MSSGRDIGSNVFLAALFVIQGLKRPEADPVRESRIRMIIASMSMAVMVAAIVFARRAWN
ncbi:hypothetical protein D3C78_1961100 [compost metagenome]